MASKALRLSVHFSSRHQHQYQADCRYRRYTPIGASQSQSILAKVPSMNKKFGAAKQPTGTPSLGWSCVVVIISLLTGASAVHNIYKPDLVTNLSVFIVTITSHAHNLFDKMSNCWFLVFCRDCLQRIALIQPTRVNLKQANNLFSLWLRYNCMWISILQVFCFEVFTACLFGYMCHLIGI